MAHSWYLAPHIGTRKLARAIAASVIAVGLAACQSDTQPTSQRPVSPPPRVNPNAPTAVQPIVAPEPVAAARTGPIRIALLAPLSGDYGEAGRELANGAALALFDSPDTPAEIIAFDTRGETAGANEAVALASAQQADIIIGPLFGRSAAAMDEALATEGLTALAFSNDGSVSGQHVLVMGRTATTETTRIIRHAASDGARTIAIFGKSDKVGDAVAQQAALEEAGLGGVRIRRALYAADTDYTTIAKQVAALLSVRARDNSRSAAAVRLQADLTAAPDPGARLLQLAQSQSGEEAARFQELAGFYQKMAGAGASKKSAVAAVIGRYRSAGGLGGGRVDAVLLTLSGPELSTVAPMFQLYDARAAGVRLLGLSGWNDMDPTRARELHGGRYASEPYSEAFDNRYEATFGELPTELAGVAYDAVKLALSAAAKGARPIPVDSLAAAGQVHGATGLVAMSAGGVALRPLEVLEMRPDGVFPVDPAQIVDPAAPAEIPTLRTAGS